MAHGSYSLSLRQRIWQEMLSLKWNKETIPSPATCYVLKSYGVPGSAFVAQRFFVRHDAYYQSRVYFQLISIYSFLKSIPPYSQIIFSGYQRAETRSQILYFGSQIPDEIRLALRLLQDFNTHPNSLALDDDWWLSTHCQFLRLTTSMTGILTCARLQPEPARHDGSNSPNFGFQPPSPTFRVLVPSYFFHPCLLKLQHFPVRSSWNMKTLLTF